MRSIAWIFLLAGFVVVCEASQVFAKKVCLYRVAPLNSECNCLIIPVFDNPEFPDPCPRGCSRFSYDNFSVCVGSSFLRYNAGWMRRSLDINGSDGNACRIDRWTCK